MVGPSWCPPRANRPRFSHELAGLILCLMLSLLSLPHFSACTKNTGFSIQRPHLHTSSSRMARPVSCPYFSYCFYFVSYKFDPSLFSHLSKSIFLYSLPLCCSSPPFGSTLNGYGEQMDRGGKTQGQGGG